MQREALNRILAASIQNFDLNWEPGATSICHTHHPGTWLLLVKINHEDKSHPSS